MNGARIGKLERAGRFHVPFKGVPRTLVAGAVDAAGNESAFVRVP